MLKKHLQQFRLNIFGKKRKVSLPVFELEDYIVRPMKESEINKILHLSESFLAEKLYPSKVKSLLNFGYNFSPAKNGIIMFVAVHKKTEKIVGRAYIKTWHIKDLDKPKFKKTSKGIEVVVPKDVFNKKDRIVELGGWLTQKEHRGNNLGKLLIYSSIDFLQRMQNLGFKAHSAFIVNVGPFKEKNHDKKIKKYIKGKGHDFKNLSELKDKGKILSEKVFNKIVSDIKVKTKTGKKKQYKFGDPGPAVGGYALMQKLVENKPLIKKPNSKIQSPIRFKDISCIHPKHGGKIIISNLK